MKIELSKLFFKYWPKRLLNCVQKVTKSAKIIQTKHFQQFLTILSILLQACEKFNGDKRCDNASATTVISQ